MQCKKRLENLLGLLYRIGILLISIEEFHNLNLTQNILLENLKIRLSNGEIDLKMTNTELLAETIHGDIYADENLDLKSYDRHVGQKISGSIGTASNQLRLNTINGNMYIRK